MFKATKPFNDTVTNYPQEPSLRIGRTVPDNAVNLAYYFNPTATDAEKILTAEAPRNTIDHRVEESWRYLFNQVSDDDDLFPKSVFYQDEEGYQGRLGRMYVTWYPEAHIETKNVKVTKDIIVTNKSELPKMFSYPEDAATDAYGYSGNVYLDAASFEVTKTKDVSETETLDREILNAELNYNVIFNSYITPSSLDTWMDEPTMTRNTCWPSYITVGPTNVVASGGNDTIVDYVANQGNTFDEAYGTLRFDRLEYEQVQLGDAINGTTEETVKEKTISASFKSPEYKYEGTLNESDSNTKIQEYVASCYSKAAALFGSKYQADYDPTNDIYKYDEIEAFLSMATDYCSNSKAAFFTKLREAMNKNKDIAVYIDSLKMSQPSGANGKFHFTAKYKYKISNRAKEGTYAYNVVAVYTGTLKKDNVTIKQVPAEYKATCEYVGIARKVWYDYDGMAYYRGAVTKGNDVGNVNPEDDIDILMFSDENGYLRRPMNYTDENGNFSVRNFYRVEADSVYLTDVFKDGTPCFYKYLLKKDIYDYRGPDFNGFYEGNAVKLYTANLKNLPKDYKYNMKLKVSEMETVDNVTEDYQLISEDVPKRYHAELYTSFISSSTDTFKVTYNAFNDKDDDNIAIDSGVIEEIYNYPFMTEGIEYQLEQVDIRARVNKIKLLNGPYRLYDSRHYISFTYVVVATRKGQVKNNGSLEIPPVEIISEPITVSILNRDYALPAEYNKFIGRGMIISPFEDESYLSPMDIILRDQTARREETVITRKSTDYVFSVRTYYELDESLRGAINFNCNPDGSGIITAETTADTGFIEGDIDLWSLSENEDLSNTTASFTRKLNLDNPYYIENGYIYPGIMVKCIDSRYITVKPPRQDGLLESWYPLLQFGHYSQILDQYGTHIKVCYTMPEYDKQHWSSKYGQPFVDVKSEKAIILNSHMIKLQCYPLLVRENSPIVSVYKKVDGELFNIEVQDISYSDGIVILKDAISENDDIICDYTYLEEYFVYRGYWRDKNDFCRIDLNPNIYHTYSDMTYTPSETKQTKNLFNKVIYFFMRPTVEYEVTAANDSLVYELEDDDDIGTVTLENASTLYHQIDNPEPESNHDIYIGSVYIRQNCSLHSTILVDSRTRGGGIIESMKDTIRKQLEPESDYYLDIGYYDGEPYQENGVIIIRLDNSLLKEFGGRFTQGEIESKVKRWLGFGVYPIIEFVDSYSKRDMPQYNLEIEDSYINVIDETPQVFLESIEIS